MSEGGSGPEAVAAGGEHDATLSVRGLRREVGGAPLWRGLTFDLAAQDRLAIRGASGSGKTVLLRTLAGLEPLGEGEVLLLGRPLTSWPMPAYRSRVMLLPQRPALREGTVESVLRAPFAFRVHERRGYRSEVANGHLAHVGRSAAFLGRDTADLSGGERQLVAVLRALLLEPHILLLDEPTASLDADATAAVEELVARWLATERGRAYVWTSHDPAQLERVSDRHVTLDGRAAAGPREGGNAGGLRPGSGGADAPARGARTP